jgi:hypothetical protein
MYGFQPMIPIIGHIGQAIVGHALSYPADDCSHSSMVEMETLSTLLLTGVEAIKIVLVTS